MAPEPEGKPSFIAYLRRLFATAWSHKKEAAVSVLISILAEVILAIHAASRDKISRDRLLESAVWIVVTYGGFAVVLLFVEFFRAAWRVHTAQSVALAATRDLLRMEKEERANEKDERALTEQRKQQAARLLVGNPSPPTLVPRLKLSFIDQMAANEHVHWTSPTAIRDALKSGNVRVVMPYSLMRVSNYGESPAFNVFAEIALPGTTCKITIGPVDEVPKSGRDVAPCFEVGTAAWPSSRDRDGRAFFMAAHQIARENGACNIADNLSVGFDLTCNNFERTWRFRNSHVMTIEPNGTARIDLASTPDPAPTPLVPARTSERR